MDSTRFDTTQPAADQADLRPNTMLQDLRRRMFGMSEQVRIGRFQLLKSLGEGGHGSVYEAYDEQLARAVALKVLNPAMLGADPEGASRRLLREAQALAQLNHPHVVQVYDSGRQGDRVWVAMELVRGASLRRWLGDADASDPNKRLEIFGLLRQAARGLAAAHELNIVHRDFKPENVLVGEDGRVRVADFGLARASSDEEPATVEDLASEAPDSPLLSVTRTGQIVGTPRYMAPEQFAGKATRASDQFAFCVTAWEALTGHYPYAAKNAADLLSAFNDEELDQTHAGRLSRTIRSALARGMSADPESRHASMAALLDALGDPRRTRSRQRRLAMGALAAAAAGVAGYLVSSQPACREGANLVEAVWGDSQRAAVADAFAAVDLGFSESTARRATAALDARSKRWAEVYDEACRVSSGDEDAPDYALATGCLRKRLNELHGVVVVLTEADETTVANVPAILATVEQIDGCSDLAALRAEASHLAGIERPAEADEWERLFATLEAKVAAGQHEGALAEIEALIEVAGAVDYVPMLANAEHLLGELWTHADPEAAKLHLSRAFEHSLAVTDQRNGARIAVSLAEVYGYLEGDVERGRQWARYARSLGKRVPVPALEDDLADVEARFLRREGRWSEALEALEQLFERSSLPPDRRVTVLSRIAQLQLYEGRYRESFNNQARLLELAEAEYGADHPYYASALMDAALVEMYTGKVDLARAHAQQAIEVVRASGFGEGWSHVGTTLLDAGVIEAWVGDPEHALELLRAAGKNLEQSTDRSSGLQAETKAQIGVALFAAGRHEEALRGLEEALADYKSIKEMQPANFAFVHAARGSVLQVLGRYEEAEAAHRLSRAANNPDDAPDGAAVDDINLAAALVGQGRLDEAEPLLVRALETLEGSGLVLHFSAANWRLGQLRMAQGRKDEGLAHLQQALETPARVGIDRAAIKAEIAAAKASVPPRTPSPN